MPEIFLAEQGWRKRRTNRAGVGGVFTIAAGISVASDLLENRAGVQAGPATDAQQRIVEWGAADARAAIVDQHQVAFDCAVYLPRTAWPPNELRINRDFLPGRGETARVCDLRPVECSAELVESTCIDTPPLGGHPARLAVPLMNYSSKPIGKMTVRITGLPKARSVRSVVRGPLAPVFDGDVMTVELPLETADMLLIDK